MWRVPLPNRCLCLQSHLQVLQVVHCLLVLHLHRFLLLCDYKSLLGVTLLTSGRPAAQCVQRCCEKFMKHSQRTGMRFQELTSEAEQQMQKLTQQQGGMQ